MKIFYIARHGEAVAVGAPGVYSDFDRHLSPAGVAKLQKQAQGLQRMGAQWQKVLSSPLLRARQTAEILNQPIQAALEMTEALGDRPSIQTLVSTLQQIQETQILLVTHQPFVGQLTSWFLSGRLDTAFHFSTGAMACIKVYQLCETPRGELQWFNSSQILQALSP